MIKQLMRHRVVFAWIAWWTATQGVAAQQVPDLEYQPKIELPAYELGRGPRIGVDEAHHNFHTSAGRYTPFAGLLRRDGYRVLRFNEQLTADSLKQVDVLVIANPLNEHNISD